MFGFILIHFLSPPELWKLLPHMWVVRSVVRMVFLNYLDVEYNAEIRIKMSYPQAIEKSSGK